MLKKRQPISIFIRPSQNSCQINLREIWDYKDLLLLFIRRDFVIHYKQTILGPVWFILQPVMMTLIFTFVFSKIAGISTQGIPGILFYLTGLLGWNYFQQVFAASCNTFVANAHIFQKIYFPRLIIPLCAPISSLASLCIQLATLVVFYSVYAYNGMLEGAHVNMYVILLPVVILQIGALGLGMGLWMSALTAKYRDLTNLNSLLMQLWMYATPIIYPIVEVPAKWRWIFNSNPMCAPIEMIKYMCLGIGSIPMHAYLTSSCITIIVLISGIFVFNAIGRCFIDTV